MASSIGRGGESLKRTLVEVLTAILACIMLASCAHRAADVASATASGMTLRRLWAGSEIPQNFGDVWSKIAVSPDGRFFVYNDGGLVRRDIATGQTRRLTTEERNYSPNVSPDGRHVAYVARSKDGRTELLLVSSSGNTGDTKPRVVSKVVGLMDVIVHGWAPDGTHILAAGATSDDSSSSWRLGAVQMLLISVADGAVRVLKTLRTKEGWAALAEYSASFSSDGRYVVYDDAAAGTLETDIYFVATDGSREGRLVAYPGNDFVLGFLPGGEQLLFASDRTGTLSAWTMQVRDGIPVGSAELVKDQLGPAISIGLTRTGVYYYRVLPRTEISLGTFDPATGAVLAAKPVSRRSSDFQATPSWSRDGRYLAYTSYAGRGYTESRAIVILEVATGAERVLYPDLTWVRNSHKLAWSPDGRSLLTCALNNEGIFNLYQIDIQSGGVSGPLLPGASVNFNFEWSKDGKAIYYIQLAAAPHPTDIRVHDLETGRTDTPYRPVDSRDSRLRDLDLSPDGAWLAVGAGPIGSSARGRDAVLVIPTGAGRPREVFRVESGQSLNFLGWTPDGDHLLFNSAGALWRVAADGGNPQRLGPATPRLTFHPDGKRVVVTAGTESGAEVWVMENFLPLKAAR